MKRGEFYDAEMLTIYFETQPDNVGKLIPPPLKPGAFPTGLAFVAHYPKTNFSPAYHESALFLMVEYGGVEGLFCLAMPVDDDTALILGREVFGYPKKMAQIHLERKGNDSRFDPWSDVEIVKIYGATYTVADATMLPGEVVAEACPLEFMPFALMKIDVF